MFCRFFFSVKRKAAQKEKLKKKKGKYSVSHTSQSKFFWAPFLSRKGAPAFIHSLSKTNVSAMASARYGIVLAASEKVLALWPSSMSMQ